MKKIVNLIIDLILVCGFISITFFLTINYPLLESFFPNELFNSNKLILIQEVKELKIIYVDENKEKIELNYREDKKWNIKESINNFYDYFEYEGVLKRIEILKSNTKNLEKEFSEGLDWNFYVWYLDKETNNLYVFAHNGTLGINGGTLFYWLEKNNNINFINSLINKKDNFKIQDKKILKKKDFIKEFTSWSDFFKDMNSIYFITCYPNYQSTSRLILKLKKEKRY